MYFRNRWWICWICWKTTGLASCGCVQSGVGCAVCGNPLGAVKIHCPASHNSTSTYIFAPSPPRALIRPVLEYGPLPRRRPHRRRRHARARPRARARWPRPRANTCAPRPAAPSVFRGAWSGI
ncbi:hypothetical protein B0H19DRAFT_1385588 [Mycena capillaripes]|nr:hypothetical protein B0H19DRAFT_1385588 [Mycena capillaripes]